MANLNFVCPDEIRTRFSQAMSAMYRAELPQYSTLVQLVAEVNVEALAADRQQASLFGRSGEARRLDLERHGAIRLGTGEELAIARRLFKVMGMQAVGYYDLSVAGVPVHSTAFRPVTEEALARNPFRVFTSLLRLELIDDPTLREEAKAVLALRQVFTPAVLRMIERCELDGGLASEDADLFVREALETFRWHSEATVDARTYARLNEAHRLLADVVCFKGPHINHLTPRTLDIDRVHAEMPARGISPKVIIEGPPPRSCPILLRQTSFKALDEPIRFPGRHGAETGTHTARFGEVEQRGIALTREGRTLYDCLLASVRDDENTATGGLDYGARLIVAFRDFPDSYYEIRSRRPGFFHYALVGRLPAGLASMSIEALIAAGHVTADPIIYEYFLPVSAAGIFQSNLDGQERRRPVANPNLELFIDALGATPLDEFTLYEEAQSRSLAAVRAGLLVI